MSDRKNTYRKSNGKRLEGYELAMKVAQSINGMMLAQAFVTVRSAGFKLNVGRLDGVVKQQQCVSEFTKCVNVDVVEGFVRRSWVL
jgi:hypothetical protein